MIQYWIRFLTCLGLLVFSGVGTETTVSARTLESFEVRAIWNSEGSTQDLGKWSLTDLSRLKMASSKEKDPQTGQSVKWEGVLLSQFVDELLKEMPTDKKAQVDLIVLSNTEGRTAYLPRAFASKYPLLLALHWDGRGDAREENLEKERSPLFLVVPWTSKPKILNEDLPLESYFIGKISKIELTNYRERYSALFLKRRTDPLAVKGEKLFIQNCQNCEVGFQTSLANDLKVNRKISSKEKKSIWRYLEAYRLENPVLAPKLIQSVQASDFQSSSRTTQ